MGEMAYCTQVKCQKLSLVAKSERLNFGQITTLFSCCSSCAQVSSVLHVRKTFLNVETEFARQFVFEFEKMALFKSHLIDFKNSVIIKNELTCNEQVEFEKQIDQGIADGKITLITEGII